MISLKNKLFISASALFLIMGTVSHQAHSSHLSYNPDDVYKAYKSNPASPQKGKSGRGSLGLALDGVSGSGLKKMLSLVAEEDKPLMTFTGKSDQPNTISDFESFKKGMTVISECFAKRLVEAIYDHYTVEGEADAAFQNLKKETFKTSLQKIAKNDYAKAFNNFMYVEIDGENYSAVTLTASRAIAKGLFDANNRDLDATYASIRAYLKLATKAFKESLDEAKSSTLKSLLEKEEEKRSTLIRLKSKAEDSVESLLDERERLQETVATQKFELQQQQASYLELQDYIEIIKVNNQVILNDSKEKIKKSLLTTLGVIDFGLNLAKDNEPIRISLTKMQEKVNKTLSTVDSENEESMRKLQEMLSEQVTKNIATLEKAVETEKLMVLEKEKTIRQLQVKLDSTEEELNKAKRESDARIHDLLEENKRIEQARLRLEEGLKVESETLKKVQLSLTQTEDRLLKKNANLKKAELEIEDLKQQAQKLTEARDEGSEKLLQSEKAKRKLEADIFRLEDEVRLAGVDNTALVDDLRIARLNLSKTRDEALVSQQTIEEQEIELQKLKKELRLASDSASDLEEDKKDLEKKARKQEELVKKHEETITDLEAELEVKEKDVLQMQAAIDSIMLENKKLGLEIKKLETENALLKGNTTPTIQAQEKIRKAKTKRDKALQAKLVVEGERDNALLGKAQVERAKLVVEGERDNALLDKAQVERAKLVVEGERDDALREKALVERDKLVVEDDLRLERLATAQLQHDKGLVDNALRLEQQAHQALQVQEAQLRLQLQQMRAQLLLVQAQLPVVPVFTLQELQENAKWQAIYDNLKVDIQMEMSDGSFVKRDKAGKLTRWISDCDVAESFEGSFITQKKKAPTIVYK
jgi:hypothetical protein